MKAARHLWLIVALSACAAAPAFSETRGGLPGPGDAGYLGLQSASTPFRINCGIVAFTCDSGGLRLYAGAWRDRPVGVNVSALQIARAGGQVQGLKVSVFGKPSRDSNLNIYGRLGTNTLRSNTAAMGAGPEAGIGVSYGVGVSWDFAARASVRLGWDTYDMRLTGAEREPLRATSLGLEWRY